MTGVEFYNPVAILTNCRRLLLTAKLDGNCGTDLGRSNDCQGIGLAMKHLVDLGHRRIGMRSGGKRTFSAASREAAFKYWIKELGLKSSECPLGAGQGNQTEYLAKLLLKNPSAVIACGEAYGVSAAYSLRLLDRHIPEDLSFVAFEYPGVSHVFPPAHTTIAQDVGELAKQAMEMVYAMESGDLARDDETRVEVDYKLLVRDSTAPPPAE